MARVRGLLFDFNGTLFFDSEFHIEAFWRCFDKYGLPRRDREYMVNKIFGRTNEEIFKKNFKADATREDIAEFERTKEDMYISICKENPDRLCLCKGAAEMFDYLAEHSVPYCIATGSPYENVKFYFDYLGLGRWFTLDNIVYTTGAFRGKPAPDIYLLAAERLALKASECAIFEDGTSGIRAANAAGAAKIIAVWENGIPAPTLDGLQVDGTYHDLSDWKSILSELELI